MWDKYPAIKTELTAFEAYLESKIPKRNAFLQQACSGVILSGGKRLRPAFTIISAMLGEYSRETAFPAAAAVEVLHTATLIHDDIIDNAKTRRGQPTISEKHSINLAVYTGDYLLARSLRLLIETGFQPERLDIIAMAVNSLCEGEIDQYLGRFEVSGVQHYLKRVMRKTGILFAASCLLGARVAKLDDRLVKQLTRFGLSFGAAFQIKDDLLDMESDEKTEGKPVIHDLKEGIATLPVILAVRNNPEIKSQLDLFFDGKGDAQDILKSVIASGGTRDALRLKRKYCDRCRKYLKALPESKEADILYDLLDWL